jgi:hypothetical protein
MKTALSQLPWYVYAFLTTESSTNIFLKAVLDLGKLSRLFRYISNYCNTIDLLSDFFKAASNGYGALVSTLTDQQLARALMVRTLVWLFGLYR